MVHCRSLREGFRIGFNYGAHLKLAESNMDSALKHPEVMAEYLEKENRLGMILGPFTLSAELPRTDLG